MEKIPYTYQFNAIDFIVIAAYLAMLICVGFLMKKLCKNVNDYFIGGNRVSWWLAGSSCFMMSFSAWTFTGAAGFAYNHGIRIILLFYFNFIAYIVLGLFLAKKCRQTRCITSLQIVYERFGRITEQFFTYITAPMMLFGGAIWLTGLATFVSVAFGMPMELTILISGTIIILYSTLGGSWGVMATDFLQSVILMALTITIAILTMIEIGGVEGFFNKIDPEKLKIFSEEHNPIWIFAYFIQTFIIFSSIGGAPRFLAVRDGKAASKAAFLAAGLFLVGPLIWFIPPIAATFIFGDISEMLPGLTHAQDGAYVLIGLHLLPNGLAGLLMMVIFAATLSSMDSAINQNAAILCMNLYKPLIRPKASAREMFAVAHIFNVVLGTLVVAASIFFAKQKELALFDLMLLLSSSISLPIGLPFLLVYWVKKAPRWAALVSVIIGTTFSALGKTYGFLAVPHRWATELLNSTGLFLLDPNKEWPLSVTVFGIVILSGGSFMLSTLFWKFHKKETKEQVARFYEKMNTPIDLDKEQIEPPDLRQFAIIGSIAMIMGGILLLLVIAPATVGGKLAIVLTGSIVFIVGLILSFISRKLMKSQKLIQK